MALVGNPQRLLHKDVVGFCHQEADGAAVTDCRIDPSELRCLVCGAAASGPHIRRNCRPGLGDYVHAGLASIGITPDRVAAALGVDDCGCEQRRQDWNEWGYKMGIGTTPTPPKEGPPPVG